MKSNFKTVTVVAVVAGAALFLNGWIGGGGFNLQTSSAVQIPEALVLALNGIAVGLFTAGFVYLFEKTGIDFREQAIPLAVSLATWTVTEAQGWINSLPDTTDPWLTLLFKILLALVPAAGLLRLVSRQPSTLLEHSMK